MPRVNAHLHTPYSFSAFKSIRQIFSMAEQENVRVLGITDFYVADGYQAFYELCVETGRFPMFNVEFIGLLKEEQKRKIRVNDPNNPGRTYFCGKGLRYPFSLDEPYASQLSDLIKESQIQVRKMIDKADKLLRKLDPEMGLDYSDIRNRYAERLVRERHIARAIRIRIFNKYKHPGKAGKALSELFGGKEVRSNLSDEAALENEIRGRLLKSGGSAFVPEEPSAFLPIDDIISIIIRAGGIPCYPVLLDNAAGEFTEYESDPRSLMDNLRSRNIACIELIPIRNDINILRDFVHFFDRNGFVITFGTEHNTPRMLPLTVQARNNTPLDRELENISYRGACVVAAHQYLLAQGREGYLDRNGHAKSAYRDHFAELGKAVVDRFINL